MMSPQGVSSAAGASNVAPNWSVRYDAPDGIPRGFLFARIAIMNLEHSPKFSTKVAAVAVPVLMVLVGAGCFSLADKAAEEAVTPVTVPVNAYVKSKEELELIAARTNEENEKLTDDITIALVLTEGVEAPAGATVAPGTFGCNDRIAYVKTHRDKQTDSVLSDALATLFANKDSNVLAAYNALWQSTLAVEKIQSTDGTTTEVWLKGTTMSGGVCDDPRIKAQLEYTIKRFKPKFKIFLNGTEANYRCLGDMSGECK
jgi:hypothetical protein